MFTEVKDKLKALGISPIFFIGSGISRRYIDSPNWVGLLEEVTKGTKINFEWYKQKHKTREEINLEELAEDLEDAYFNNLSEDEFEKDGSKPYYFRKKISNIIKKYLEDKIDSLNKNEEIKELKKTNPSVIITTNYDELLEEVFGEDYTVHIGQESLLTNVLDGVGEIYKIHGSVTDPNSIVVTKSDYENFFEKDSYLNAKLLTLFLEYPIIFLGYSISDRNVKSILTTIVKMLPQEKVDELRSRIWFVTMAENEEDRVISKRINLEEGLYIDINSYELNNFGDFYKSISDINIKRLPIKFLKYLKNNTYQLVASQEYNPKLLNVNIQDLESIKDFNEVSKFVGLTFSTREKRMLSSRIEFCRAFLSENEEIYDSFNVLDSACETNSNVPIYKFIKDLNIVEILQHIEEISGTECKLYDLISNDKKDYIKNLGVKKDNINYNGALCKKEIENYSCEYIKQWNLYENQKGAVIRYVILDILNNRLNELSKNKEFCVEFKKYIELALTNLDKEYVKSNIDLIKIIINNINDNKYDSNFRNLLCFIDRIIYREQVNGIESN